MAIVLYGHNIVTFEDLNKVIRKLQETIKEYYVRKEDLQMMVTNDQVLLSKEQIEELVGNVVREMVENIISRDYVSKKQHQMDLQALREELTGQGVQNKTVTPLPGTTLMFLHDKDEYDPLIFNAPNTVYVDSKGNRYYRGELISETISERTIYESPVYESYDTFKAKSNEEKKPELTEFTQADLDAYAAKAFDSHVPPRTNPTVDECRAKWDDISNSLKSQWDELDKGGKG